MTVRELLILCLFHQQKMKTPRPRELTLGSQLGHNCLVFRSSLLRNDRSEHPSHISWWEEATHRKSHHRLLVPLSRVLTEHSLPQDLPLLHWIIWESWQVFVGLWYLDRKEEQKGIPGLAMLRGLPNLWVIGAMFYSSRFYSFDGHNFKIFFKWELHWSSIK